MKAPRLRALLSFFTPTEPAANRRGVHKSFCDFIPPLLLRPGPYFVFATIDTTKRPIYVVSSSNEIRSAVTIVGCKQLFVHGNESIRRMPQFMRLRHRLYFLAALCSCSLDFVAPLFAAFHRESTVTSSRSHNSTISTELAGMRSVRPSSR